MSTFSKNLSYLDSSEVPSAKGMLFGIVAAEWNREITGALLEGALSTLEQQGALKADVTVKWVPGSFELPLGAKLFCEHSMVDAVICLGCVIEGETRHFEFICQSVAQGIKDVSLEYILPVVFGVLTTDNLEQAKDRAGGKHGNKGVEAAVTAIKMVALEREMG